MKKRPIEQIMEEILEQLKIMNSRPIMPPYTINTPAQTQIFPQCTCIGRQTNPNVTTPPCPIHPLNPPYIATN